MTSVYQSWIRNNGSYTFVQVQVVDNAEGHDGVNVIDVGSQYLHDWSSIEAKWYFLDNESPIVEYSWAIGEYETLLFSTCT